VCRRVQTVFRLTRGSEVVWGGRGLTLNREERDVNSQPSTQQTIPVLTDNLVSIYCLLVILLLRQSNHPSSLTIKASRHHSECEGFPT